MTVIVDANVNNLSTTDRQIVRMVPEDHELLRQYREKFVVFVEEWSSFTDVHIEKLERRMTELNQGTFLLWGAVRGGQLEAFAGREQDGEMVSAWVSSECRGNGLHSRLIGERIAHGGWYSKVLNANNASRRSLEKSGLAYVGQTPSGLFQIMELPAELRRPII